MALSCSIRRLGPVRKPRPVIYQEHRRGAPRPSPAHYVVDDCETRVGFAIGPYDPTHALVIDPLLRLLDLSRRSRQTRSPAGIAVDAAGNVYVTGTTTSVDFPTSPGAHRPAALGGTDVFVTKFSAAGARVYSTYLGTPCDDSAGGIAVDASGSAYVTGQPGRAGAPTRASVPDYPGVFVAKLDPHGRAVLFLLFGPATFDSSHGRAIAVDNAGQAYITGVTSRRRPASRRRRAAFRTASRAARSALDFSDGFVAKVNAAGTALVYSTYLCGSGHDSPNAIAIDAAGNAYVAGSTDSLRLPDGECVPGQPPRGACTAPTRSSRS